MTNVDVGKFSFVVDTFYEMVGNDTSYVVLDKNSFRPENELLPSAPKRSTHVQTVNEPELDVEVPEDVSEVLIERKKTKVERAVDPEPEVELKISLTTPKMKESGCSNDKLLAEVEPKISLNTPGREENGRSKGILRTPASVNSSKLSKNGRRSVSFARTPPSHVTSRQSLGNRAVVTAVQSLNRRITLPAIPGQSPFASDSEKK